MSHLVSERDARSLILAVAMGSGRGECCLQAAVALEQTPHTHAPPCPILGQRHGPGIPHISAGVQEQGSAARQS